jgi:hypothetical protein
MRKETGGVEGGNMEVVVTVRKRRDETKEGEDCRRCSRLVFSLPSARFFCFLPRRASRYAGGGE